MSDDLQTLIGTYHSTEDDSFEWRQGPMLRAMVSGTPLLLEDIDGARPDVLARLCGAIEDGRLRVNGHGIFNVHERFRVLATLR